jgi:predicted transcriptional regulator
MRAKRNIAFDDATATSLEERAAERGMSVSDLVREFLARDAESAPADAEQIAELDRRWAAIEAGEETVPNERVVRWLQSWGTRSFRPWQRQ